MKPNSSSSGILFDCLHERLMRIFPLLCVCTGYMVHFNHLCLTRSWSCPLDTRATDTVAGDGSPPWMKGRGGRQRKIYSSLEAWIDGGWGAVMEETGTSKSAVLVLAANLIFAVRRDQSMLTAVIERWLMTFIALGVTASLKMTVIYSLIYSSDAPAVNPTFPEGVRVIQRREINLCGRGGVCVPETRASSNQSRCSAATCPPARDVNTMKPEKRGRPQYPNCNNIQNR